jgi:hypothetical protein
MKRITTHVLLAASQVVLWGSTANVLRAADTTIASAQICRGKIEHIKNLIAARGGKIGDVRYETLRNSPFSNAMTKISITFDLFDPGGRRGWGKATKNQDLKNLALNNSPLILKSYASYLIMSCEQVASVSFTYYEGSQTFSMHPGGHITMDKCSQDHPNLGLKWGEEYCF